MQEKLLQMQIKHHLCVHKQELTELDIYNRILRFKNYEVAMVNQALLPPKIETPFFGQLYSHLLDYLAFLFKLSNRISFKNLAHNWI